MQSQKYEWLTLVLLYKTILRWLRREKKLRDLREPNHCQ